MTKPLQPKTIYINHETKQPVLFMAMELSNSNWKLAFSNGDTNRMKNVTAGDMDAVKHEIELAKKRFGLQEEATEVYCCYEAGRDGFWIYHWLCSLGIVCHVIDSSSIEQNRKNRKAKTDRIDALKLAKLMVRHIATNEPAFSVVQVPDDISEDNMELQRERERLMKAKTRATNAISALLVKHNVREYELGKGFDESLEQMRTHDEKPLGKHLKNSLKRLNALYLFLLGQLDDIEKEKQQRLADHTDEVMGKVRSLMLLKGVGLQSAWLLVMELFGWRTFKNRRKLAGFVGLTGTPYDSGDSVRDQGISKAGSRRVRALLVELSWLWLRHQPQSDLAQWFERRFANGGKRMRRIGIVGVARKLLIALWRFVEEGTVPQGAVLSA